MRSLARERRRARVDQAITGRLESLSRDASERVARLEAGTAAIARRCADLEEIAVGHESAAQQLARWLWHVAAVHGDPVLTDERVQALVRHYLPELGGPTRDHARPGTGPGTNAPPSATPDDNDDENDWGDDWGDDGRAGGWSSWR